MVLGSKEGDILRSPGNSFMLEFSKVFSFSEKTAFIIHNEEASDFNSNNLKIYFQSGNFINNSTLGKVNLHKNFTTIRKSVKKLESFEKMKICRETTYIF